VPPHLAPRSPMVSSSGDKTGFPRTPRYHPATGQMNWPSWSANLGYGQTNSPESVTPSADSLEQPNDRIQTRASLIRNFAPPSTSPRLALRLLWAQTYQREEIPPNNLSVVCSNWVDHPKMLTAGQEAEIPYSICTLQGVLLLKHPWHCSLEIGPRSILTFFTRAQTPQPHRA
jgi:hypothetical protein